MEGIDVSHWQETIDWAKVAGAGKKFAYLKATESTDFLDNKYATNRSKAKANGIKVGAYHFARPGTNTDDAVNEATWFIKNAAPISGELLPVLDLEVTGGLTDAQLEAWTKAFMDRVYSLTGVRGAIYVSPSFWSSNVGNSTKIAAAGYKVLWIAHWTTGVRPDRPGQQLERQRLDVLAVHLERLGERDQRPGRPQPLPVQRPGQGAHPLTRGTGGRSAGAIRPSPMLLRHGDGRHHGDPGPARR